MTETRQPAADSTIGAETRPDRPQASQKPAGLIQFPREHGAWGMLLFPFLSAMLLTKAWSWNFIPATFAVLAVFLIREPLAVLARQKYVWAHRRPEAFTARRSAAVLSPALLLSGIWLVFTLPFGWMVLLAVVAAAMTVGYVVAVVRNRQRSVLFQIAGSTGLCGSALLGYLAGGRSLEETVLLLWAVHILHNTASVLTVHSLIDARKARKAGNASTHNKRAAIAWHLLQFAVAALFLFIGRPWLGAALLVPWAVHTTDIARLDRSPYLQRPLRKLGLRELGLTACFSAAVIAALW